MRESRIRTRTEKIQKTNVSFADSDKVRARASAANGIVVGGGGCGGATGSPNLPLGASVQQTLSANEKTMKIDETSVIRNGKKPDTDSGSGGGGGGSGGGDVGGAISADTGDSVGAKVCAKVFEVFVTKSADCANA